MNDESGAIVPPYKLILNFKPIVEDTSPEARGRLLAEFYRDMYVGDARKEQELRANTIPFDWVWLSSGMDEKEIDELNPNFRRTNEITTDKTWKEGTLVSGIWVKTLPTDHTGRYNSYAMNRSEMVFVAPPGYFLQDPAPVLDVGTITWDHIVIREGNRFSLVATENVEIVRPENPNSDAPPVRIKRYILVPTQYKEEYFRQLSRPNEEIFHTERTVVISGAAEQYLRTMNKR